MSFKVSGCLAALVLLISIIALDVTAFHRSAHRAEFNHRPYAVESRNGYNTHSGANVVYRHVRPPAAMEIRHTRVISPVPIPLFHSGSTPRVMPALNRSTSEANDSLTGCPSRCTQGVWNELEAPLSSYIAGVEALTSSIQELDEAVQQMQPSQFASCDEMRVATTSTTQAPLASTVSMLPMASATAPQASIAPTTTLMPLLVSSPTAGQPAIDRQEFSETPVVRTTTEMLVESTTASSSMAATTEMESLVSSSSTSGAPVEASSERALEASTTAASIESMASSTLREPSSSPAAAPLDAAISSFVDQTDGYPVPASGMPLGLEEYRRRREVEPSNELYGQPSGQMMNRARDELSQVSFELEKLGKELGATAEWLKQNNHTVHSVMLRALQVYVTSIERHIEHRRSSEGKPAKIELLKSKINKIKDKVAHLFEKLKSLLPHKHQQPPTVVAAVREGGVGAGVNVDASSPIIRGVVNPAPLVPITGTSGPSSSSRVF